MVHSESLDIHALSEYLLTIPCICNLERDREPHSLQKVLPWPAGILGNNSNGIPSDALIAQNYICYLLNCDWYMSKLFKSISLHYFFDRSNSASDRPKFLAKHDLRLKNTKESSYVSYLILRTCQILQRSSSVAHHTFLARIRYRRVVNNIPPIIKTKIKHLENFEK